jgi:hypothetical protein
MKTAILRFGQGANCVGWSADAENACPPPPQGQAITGRPRRPGPARPSHPPASAGPGTLPRRTESPRPFPVLGIGCAETRRTRRHAPSASPTSVLSSGGPNPTSRRTGAPNNPPVRVARPVAEWPSHTSAAAQYTAADASTYGHTPDRSSVEWGWDSAFQHREDFDPPCAHNSHGSKGHPARNADRLVAGKPRGSVPAHRDVEEVKQ